ncbi:MAG: hypothetical protein P8Y99_09830 [Calditrichaceae bacterium]
MKSYQPHIFVVLFILLQFCGENPVEKGKKAFLEKNYNESIKLLTSSDIAKQSRTDQINEVIVLSYMYRGKELYEKTKNVKSFSGNYKSSLKYLPDSVSSNFKTEYSILLGDLSEAYAKAKAENEFEQDKFNKNSI